MGTITVPDGSIYFWMYNQGLKHVPLRDIEFEIARAGKIARPKDIQNYWNGWFRSDLYDGRGEKDVFNISNDKVAPSTSYFDTKYSDYPDHPYTMYPEISNRFVPCNNENKPMIKWSEGCLTYVDAMCWPGSKYIAENTKGCTFIVIDCDGDHGDDLDMRTIEFLHRYTRMTHVLSKPKSIRDYEGWEWTNIQEPASFHLTFTTDKLIPTMHFPYAGIDIIGNRTNSLRYFKNKVWNNLTPSPMTDKIWNQIKRYIKSRRESQCL